MRLREALFVLFTLAVGLPAGSCIGGGGDMPPTAPSSSGSALPTLAPPPIDLTVATTLYTSSHFLYTGNNPVQTGMKPDTIDPSHVAVLRGTVRTRDGQALSGVRVTVFGHCEYGQTLTRQDGVFDLVVNGGGLLTVAYDKDGFLPAHRQVNAPWQRYAWADPLVMVPYDDKVSAIDTTSVTAFQVARGNPVSDQRGDRQATVLFPAGMQATMTVDGSQQPLSALHVRATEFTVGKDGPATMPASLPKNSAYTYALDLSVDEAVAAGASQVQFSQPVYFYLDNFLGFDSGIAVPMGYYDRERAVWVASESGVVVKILRIENGQAVVDLEGRGEAAGAAVLTKAGFTPAELQQLATLYQPGQGLWRVPLRHFSNWDANWNMGEPTGAVTPPLTRLTTKQVDKPCKDCGSIIEVQNQNLGEILPVPGVAMDLVYKSDRTAGHVIDYQINIPLSGSSVPSVLTRIDLQVFVAGQTFTQSFPPNPNQNYTYTWNGQNAYGQVVQGRQPITAQVGYIYSGTYQATPTFGASGTQTTVSASTMEIGLWQQWNDMVGTFNDSVQQMGGADLSVHHTYDVSGATLFSGDGTRRSGEMVSPVITCYAGCGTTNGNGGLATAAALSHPTSVALGSDGSLYIAESGPGNVRKVSPSGVISAFATGVGAFGLALGSDGSLYVANRAGNSVQKISPAGVVSSFAGGSSGYSGDGGPATAAALNLPTSVAVGSDGSVYIADTGNNVIRRVTTDGNIHTFAGTGAATFGGDGGAATSAQLYSPYGIGMGPDGSLYIADSGNLRIRQVNPSGIISTVAGNGLVGENGDNGPAVSARLNFPYGVTVGPDGSIYIADTSNVMIRRVDPNGNISIFAGVGVKGDAGDGGSALQAELAMPMGMALATDGSLYVADGWLEAASQVVRKIASPMPGYYAGSQFYISSEDGGEVYVFRAPNKTLLTGNSRG